mgnify:CR=1 FL=1
MDHLLNIQDARKYFLPRNEKFANRTANVLADIPPEEPQPLESVGKQGMFALCYTDKALDMNEDVATRVKTANNILKGSTALVVGKNNEDHPGKSFITPPGDLLEIAKNLPLLSAFKSSEATNTKSTTVVEFSAAFLETVLALGVGEADPLTLVAAQKFIQSLGETIKISADVSLLNYNVTTFSGMTDIVGSGKIVDIEPMFRIVGTSLSITDVKVAIANCGVKIESFTLNFKADVYTAALDFDAYENDKDVQADIDQLIGGGLVQQVDKAKNYFGVKPKSKSK